jgi:hypothetical protein
LKKWYEELNNHTKNIPTVVVANKIDGLIFYCFCFYEFTAEPRAVSKEFAFASKNNLPIYYCSAYSGVNVVKVVFFFFSILFYYRCLMMLFVWDIKIKQTLQTHFLMNF